MSDVVEDAPGPAATDPVDGSWRVVGAVEGWMVEHPSVGPWSVRENAGIARQQISQAPDRTPLADASKLPRLAHLLASELDDTDTSWIDAFLKQVARPRANLGGAGPPGRAD